MFRPSKSLEREQAFYWVQVSSKVSGEMVIHGELVNRIDSEFTVMIDVRLYKKCLQIEHVNGW